MTQERSDPAALRFPIDCMDGGRGVGLVETMKSFTSTSKRVRVGLDYATGTTPSLHIIIGPTGGKDVSQVTSSGERLAQVLIPPGLVLRFAQPVRLEVQPKNCSEERQQRIRARNERKLRDAPDAMKAVAEKVLNWTVKDDPGDNYPYGRTLEMVICYPGNYDYVKAMREKRPREEVLG